MNLDRRLAAVFVPLIGVGVVLLGWSLSSRTWSKSLPSPSRTWEMSKPYVTEPLEKRLREDTRDDPGISWLGPLEPDALWASLHEAGFLPYRAEIPESFALIVLEAQAAGCLPIVTPLGALRERVVHGKTGWVEEAAGFEARMTTYAASASEPSMTELRDAAGAEAGKLTWDASAHRFEEALEKARRAAVL